MTHTIIRLLFSFFQIGLCSIGGGYATIPLIKEQVVTLHHWLTVQQFTDIITISQMTPGPIAVNTSTFVGLQIAGPAGAAVATLGCVISGFTLSLILYRFFHKHRGSDYVCHVLRGLKAASAGLILSAAGSILGIAFFGDDDISAWSPAGINLVAFTLFAACLFILRKWKLNPILLMVISGAAGLLLYR